MCQPWRGGSAGRSRADKRNVTCSPAAKVARSPATSQPVGKTAARPRSSRGRSPLSRREVAPRRSRAGEGRTGHGYHRSRWPAGGCPKVRDAAEGSLRRLQTDWIDLYQVGVSDRNTDIDETLGALSSRGARYRSCRRVIGGLSRIAAATVRGLSSGR
jgi:hypothetical protein